VLGSAGISLKDKGEGVLQLLNICGRGGIERALNGRLVGTSGSTESLLESGIAQHISIGLIDGDIPRQHSEQTIQQFVVGLVQDGFLLNLNEIADGGKKIRLLKFSTEQGQQGVVGVQFGGGFDMLGHVKAPFRVRFDGLATTF
jgi:hypothetical protein